MGCFNFFKKTSASDASSVTLRGDDTSSLKEKTEPIVAPSSSDRVPTGDRLVALRNLMEEKDIDLYLVPSEDPHGSEYTSARDGLRTFISGFTGSVGVAIISRKEWNFAGLWVDSRYFVQAEEQIDGNWTLFKVGLEGVPAWDKWLTKDAFDQFDKKALRFGVDSRLMSYNGLKSLLEAASTEDRKLLGVFEEASLVAKVWTDPSLPFHRSYPEALDEPVHEHPLKFSGEEADKKLKKVVQWLNGVDIEDILSKKDVSSQSKGPKRGQHFVVNALDETAWLFNLRGLSIPHNPVFPSYAIISVSEDAAYSAQLFIPADLLSSKDKDTWHYVTETIKVEVHEYSTVWGALSKLPGDGKVIVSDKASFALVNAVGPERAAILPSGDSPVALIKACKNPVELQGMRNAYLRDGVAWVRWAAWLEEAIRRRGKKISEWDAAVQFQKYRAEMHNYAGFDAYDPISGTGQHAALPHYETPEKGSATINTETPYLNDSGAQYFDGTIDGTRTYHYGKPTSEQKRAYTRVLQGHIAIDSCIFPAGTSGQTIDVLARANLWKDGLQYLHGTGHGIGSYGLVHEGPSTFWLTSPTGKQVPTAFRPGMTLSNEPGFYQDQGKKAFGIRLESIIAVKEVKIDYKHGDSTVHWFGFERLTRVPISTNLVDFSLLNDIEKKWLKDHNDQIKEEVGALLGHQDKRAKKWLAKQ